MRSTPRIAIASAFELELAPLLRLVVDAEHHDIGGVIFTTGTLAGHEAVLFSTGVSMVNAAMNTQRALDHFTITTLFYTGIAGGLFPDAEVGDVFVPSRWGQYQESVYARAQTDGTFSPPSWLDSPLQAFGMMFPKAVTVRGEAYFWFEADAALVALAETRIAGVFSGGNGVSGQAFVDNRQFANYLVDTFNAQVVDMESAAVAQVAFANEVPFLIVRAVSDVPGETGETAMRENAETAARFAADGVRVLLQPEVVGQQ